PRGGVIFLVDLPRSQTPVWERLASKLRFGPESVRERNRVSPELVPKQEFGNEEPLSPAGPGEKMPPARKSARRPGIQFTPPSPEPILSPFLLPTGRRLSTAFAFPRSDRCMKGQPENFPNIPGYQFLEKLGEGGMGTVYRAAQFSSQQTVAIKVLQPR